MTGRRGRHSGWKLAGLVVLLAVFVVTYQCVRAFMATPRPTMDYVAELDRLARAAQPEEGENAWPVYLRIMEDVLRLDESGRPREDSPLRDPEDDEALWELVTGDWDDPAHDRGKAVLAALRDEMIPLLEEAVSRPVFLMNHAEWWEEISARWDVRAVNMGNFARSGFGLSLGNVNSFLAAEARAAAEEEDWDRFVSIVELAAVGLLRHSKLEVDLAVRFRMPSIARSVLGEVGRQLNERRLPRVVCERLLDALEGDWLDDALLRQELELLRLSVANDLEWLYGSNGVAALWMWDDPWYEESELTPSAAERIGNLRALLLPRRGTSERAMEAYLEALETWWMLPAPDRPDAPDVPAWVDVNPFVEQFREYAGNRRRGMEIVLQEIAATRVMLRLNLHSIEHGRMPDALTDAMAVEETLEPTTGDPFEYQLTPADPEGRPYELRAPASIQHPAYRVQDRVMNPARGPIPSP